MPDGGIDPVDDSAALGRVSHAISGVVATGFFLDIAETVLVAESSAVRTVRPPPRRF
ncbi:MAG: hypothetical protein HY002_12865 [Candidatus Rokubacteria bacterium]|nr:hypothetical protein [Candidatus Rokubacteria bacterium]